ncbi:hypothetical protein FIBSPDRAFT_549999 [Athelia psychrophila]|uniref:Uncharacterized protein n=1 Tax=Athelia psychrophila TaxID=1759441 RepID=A0A166USH4_9AGAM|nr:hypothetical protein FIBSPDRAFT_549999 [Fibularhizoctonia sp. CBS 109695]
MLHILVHYHADCNENDGLVQYKFRGTGSACGLLWCLLSSSNGPATATSPTTSTRSPAKSEAPPARSSTIQHLIPSIPATWNPFWALLASPPVDKLGRRFLFHMNRTGTSIFFLTQMICIQRYQARQTDAAAHGMIAFICLVYAAYDLAFTPLIVRCIFGILLYHPVQRVQHPQRGHFARVYIQSACEPDCAGDVGVEVLHRLRSVYLLQYPQEEAPFS